jgi:ankyrin repeat domain-containing protein 50
MADPLSVAAAVAGLISLGIQVTRGLVVFYTTCKDQDERIVRIVRRLENLLKTFGNLDQALQNRQFKADEVDQLESVAIAVENCRDIITELQIELEKFSSTSEKGNTTKKGIQAAAKRAGRKLAYPFRESTLQKLDEDISEFRSNVLVALNVLQLKVFDDVQQDTANLAALVNLMRTSHLSDAARDWLKAPDPFSNYNESCRKRHPRTGLWLVNGPVFQRWLEEHHSFLWMHGRPGCGKTILSSTVIQHTLRHRRNNTDIGIAFHYFTFSDNSKQHVSGLLRTLLLQLSNQLDDGDATLTQLSETYKDGEPPIQALEGTLKQVVGKFQDVYVIIDALDESPRGDRRDAVLDTLSEMRGWKIRGLHLLVTSRDEPDIRAQVTPQMNEEVCMDNGVVDQDIKDYVVQRLRDDRKFKKFAQYHTEIENTLIERADGV